MANANRSLLFNCINSASTVPNYTNLI